MFGHPLISVPQSTTSITYVPWSLGRLILTIPDPFSNYLSPPPPKFRARRVLETTSNCQLHFSLRGRLLQVRVSNSAFNGIDKEFEDEVEDLRVPDHWLDPARATQEAEWLRVSLHKWLDDEYCPEPTNILISKVASESYHQALLSKLTDLGEILLEMIKKLETISYQESFHGAFSSANAAISLIAQRIEDDE